jgi:hypothetical protein
MSTYTQITSEVQNAVGRTTADELTLIQRSANIGVQRFKSVMRRPWSRISKKTDIVASQQDYQLPRSVLRPSGVSFLYGSNYFPLREIGSEENWNRLNAVPSVTIGIPRFFFPKGKNIISLYPVPGTALSEGLKVYYEPKQPKMIASDYSTGTVTVTQNSQTITHSAAGFTEDMVGRTFMVTDGSDGYEYLITAYVSSSQLTLENYYEGISGAGRSFLIGVVPDIPEEYHDSVIDYCIARLYLRRKDPDAAKSFMDSFNAALIECKQQYASPTSDDVLEDMYGMSINMFDIPPIGLS